MLKIATAVVLMGVASPALAQSAWSVEGVAGVVSDYRYRGYSLSDQQPALQAGLTARHRSGFYGDVYASTMDEYGLDTNEDGAHVELTGSVGWAGDIRGIEVDVAVSRFVYPGGEDVDYAEIPVQIGRTIGDVAWALGAAYAPSQSALGNEDNRYGWVSLSYAPSAWPVSLSSHLGYEDGAFAQEGKTDWVIGLARDLGPATMDLSWTDSDREAGALVASVFLSF